MSPLDECRELEVALSAYADGELRCEGLRFRVMRHLRLCFACQETLRDYGQLAALMVETRPPEVPDELSARILAALAAKEQQDSE